MRQNCRQVYNAWHNGKSCNPAMSIWTDGTTIYSYSTAIVTRPKGSCEATPTERIILNRTQYSSTTSTHQTALLSRLGTDLGQWPVIVTGLPKGATADDLRAAAEGVTEESPRIPAA